MKRLLEILRARQTLSLRYELLSEFGELVQRSGNRLLCIRLIDVQPDHGSISSCRIFRKLPLFLSLPLACHARGVGTALRRSNTTASWKIEFLTENLPNAPLYPQCQQVLSVD